ncbi:ThiF family adenylyltransferase [Bifidobacterium catenulatum]|nr:ThiF family adenylyltransferase [Bifidobacterium catenulatum]
MALTRIGVGHLHLIDFDRVDMTNLNRQQYF